MEFRISGIEFHVLFNIINTYSMQTLDWNDGNIIQNRIQLIQFHDYPCHLNWFEQFIEQLRRFQWITKKKRISFFFCKKRILSIVLCLYLYLYMYIYINRYRCIQFNANQSIRLLSSTKTQEILPKGRYWHVPPM